MEKRSSDHLEHNVESSHAEASAPPSVARQHEHEQRAMAAARAAEEKDLIDFENSVPDHARRQAISEWRTARSASLRLNPDGDTFVIPLGVMTRAAAESRFSALIAAIKEEPEWKELVDEGSTEDDFTFNVFAPLADGNTLQLQPVARRLEDAMVDAQDDDQMLSEPSQSSSDNDKEE